MKPKKLTFAESYEFACKHAEILRIKGDEEGARRAVELCRGREISIRLSKLINNEAQIALLMNTLEGVIEALESLLGDKLDLTEWNANKALRANTTAEVDAEIASLEEEHSKEAEDGGI